MKVENHIDHEAFFQEQLKTWELARQNYEGLASAQLRVMQLRGCDIAVQYNPARMVSTGASIDKKVIAERPCFLCRKNRPTVQTGVPLLGHYELLVNPFPILPRHFTLASMKHESQSIHASYVDMMHMTRLLPSLFLFYNGPRCGASAPDHLHFQAGSRGIVPLERDFKSSDTTSGISELRGYLVRGWVIQAATPEESGHLFSSLYETMPIPEGDTEPMMNLLAWYDTEARCYVTIVIPRRKHRPMCYSAEGEGKCLVSPGALDMGGLIITPRAEDFGRMTPELAQQILQEVGL